MQQDARLMTLEETIEYRQMIAEQHLFGGNANFAKGNLMLIIDLTIFAIQKKHC
jgi:hypothetical protein